MSLYFFYEKAFTKIFSLYLGQIQKYQSCLKNQEKEKKQNTSPINKY